jgi:hypothetical protein
MSKETRYRNVIHHRQYPLDVGYFKNIRKKQMLYFCVHILFKVPDYIPSSPHSIATLSIFTQQDNGDISNILHILIG